MRRFIPLCLVLLILGFYRAPGQLPAAIPRNALKSIKDKAFNNISRYEALINIVANVDGDQSPEDVRSVIDKHLARGTGYTLFYNAEREIVPDWHWTKSEQKDKETIRNFLTGYSTNYAGKAGASITISRGDYSKIYLGYGGKAYFMRVFYKQKMSGKDVNGRAYPAELQRYADMWVERDNKDFLVLIYDIGFQ